MQLILTENGVVRAAKPSPTPMERQQIKSRVAEQFSRPQTAILHRENMEIKQTTLCDNCFQRSAFAGSELCRICLNAKNRLDARADLIRATKLWLATAAVSGIVIVLLVYFFGVRSPRPKPVVKKHTGSVTVQSQKKTVPF